MKKHLLIALVAAGSLAACSQTEPEVVEQYDPMEDELANAAPVDITSVPMMVSSHPYRCSGSNAVLQVDYLRTGDALSARVTPAGADGINLEETSPGTFSDGNNTLNGGPDATSVTFNGASCKRG